MDAPGPVEPGNTIRQAAGSRQGAPARPAGGAGTNRCAERSHPLTMPQRLLPRLFLALLFIAVSALSTGANAQFGQKSSAAAGSVVTTPYVRAELLAHAPQGVAPGQPLWLGLQITHQPEWHTYWKNPGDSGLPTELVWTLPAGLDAGEIAWPLPRKIPIGTLANYGYEGTVLLPVPVTVASTFAPGPLAKDATIKLRASWLVCRKQCIPEEGEFTLHENAIDFLWQ